RRSDRPRSRTRAGALAARFGRRMSRSAREIALGLFLASFLVGSAGADVVTFLLLLRLAGGAAEIARDSGVAWLAEPLAAVAAFVFLHRAYAEIDRLDRRFERLERSENGIERAFWARF
ncbi:MAG: hypothetical protein ACRECR_07540, partial [Thermoplasmata archaeon]